MAVRANYTGSATASPTNWTASDALAHATAINAYETQISSVAGVPVSGDTTGVTDTAAIQAVHDALPASGGLIRLRAGAYYLTAAGLIFTKKVKMLGAGCGWLDSSGITVLYSLSTTGTGITTGGKGSVYEDFALVNGSTGTMTAGAGILLTHADECILNRVYIFGFYDNTVVPAGGYYTLRDGFNVSPWRYGIKTANSESTDFGDQVIDNMRFTADGARQNPSAAIRWEGGGGMRITNCKINQGSSFKFNIGIDCAFDGSTIDTADTFIHDNSIENVATIGIKLSRTTGTKTVTWNKIKNNEFMATPTGIQVGTGWLGVELEGNTFIAANTKGIDVLTGAHVIVRRNDYWPTATGSTCVSLASGVDKNSRVGLQDLFGGVDAVLVANAVTGVGTPAIDYDYKLGVDWTVGSTPVTVWTLGVDDYQAGIVEVLVCGLHNNVGPGLSSRKFNFTVDGATHAVTVVDMETVTVGAASVIATTTAANSIAIKLSNADNNLMVGSLMYLNVKGNLKSLKRGA